jgi:amino acid transporter
MTVHSVHGRAHADGRQARWAVWLATAAVAVLALAAAVFGVAYAVAGVEATEDNWVGLLAAVGLLGGLAVSLVAFTLAVLARINHERRPLMWLPLSVFPALLGFVVLGELFWWE